MARANPKKTQVFLGKNSRHTPGKSSKTAATELEARRVPTQERSKKRVQAILDAAANIFADIGFERATMEGIAEAADTSIGSLYQFYPNKLRLFQGVAERCIEDTRKAFDVVVASRGADTPWELVLDIAVDGLALLRENDAGFRALVQNFQLYGVFAESDMQLSQYIAEQLRKWLRSYFPEMSSERRRTAADMLVRITAAMLVMVQQESPKMRARLLSETKFVLRSYLQAASRA